MIFSMGNKGESESESSEIIGMIVKGWKRLDSDDE